MFRPAFGQPLFLNLCKYQIFNKTKFIVAETDIVCVQKRN